MPALHIWYSINSVLFRAQEIDLSLYASMFLKGNVPSEMDVI